MTHTQSACVFLPFNVLYRTLETMSSPTATMRTPIDLSPNGENEVMSRSMQARTVAARVAAPAGDGIPLNSVWTPSSGASMLKRANLRRAPQANRKHAMIPNHPASRRANPYMSTAGAMPKLTPSARLSSSMPNLVDVFVQRATFPSKVSKTMLPKMNSAAV